MSKIEIINDTKKIIENIINYNCWKKYGDNYCFSFNDDDKNHALVIHGKPSNVIYLGSIKYEAIKLCFVSTLIKLGFNCEYIINKDEYNCIINEKLVYDLKDKLILLLECSKLKEESDGINIDGNNINDDNILNDVIDNIIKSGFWKHERNGLSCLYFDFKHYPNTNKMIFNINDVNTYKYNTYTYDMDSEKFQTFEKNLENILYNYKIQIYGNKYSDKCFTTSDYGRTMKLYSQRR